jgi:hypothetical protein
MQGSWELIFQSSLSPNNYKVLELNLTQAGTHVFAGSPSSLVFQSTSNNLVTRLPLTQFGGHCDSGAVGSVTADATLSNQGPTLETVSFTFTETGALGSVVITASASTNGSSIASGTYSIPAACGFPADQGTFFGYQDSVHFSADVFSGTLNNGADVVVANLTSSANSFDLTISGTDNGAQFTLTGSTVGFSLNLTGNFAGKVVSWFGLYDPTYNSFLIYDSNAQHVGNLHAGAIP